MHKQILSIGLIIFLLTSTLVFGQTPINKTNEKTAVKKPEKSAPKDVVKDEKLDEKSLALKNEAIDLLRENLRLAVGFNSLDNRIGYTLRNADILWEFDEREARLAFQNSMNDLRGFIAQSDSEYIGIETAVSNKPEAQNQDLNNSDLSRIFAGNGTQNLFAKPIKITRLRLNVVTTLANHDPKMAYDFLLETQQMFNSKVLQEVVTQNDKYQETQLLNQIAAKDVSVAFELGSKKLAKGFSADLLSLLYSIYAKDAEKGAEFGEAIVKKMRGEKNDFNLYSAAVNLLRVGSNFAANISSTKSDKKTLLNDQSLRSLSEIIVNSSSTPSDDVIKLIIKYLPTSAEKYKQQTSNQPKVATASTGGGIRTGRGNGSGQAPNNYWGVLNQALRGSMLGQADLSKSISGITKDKKTVEELEQQIEEKRGQILSNESLDFRFLGLIMLATHCAKIEQKETATRLLTEAESLLNSTLKQQKDFNNNYILANGFSVIDIEKTFTILENTVYQLNDIISAFVKVGEFNPGINSSVEDGELLMTNNQYGSRFFSVPNETLKKLAETDFNRLKMLTDKFERTEMRAETKFIIVRSIIGKKPNVATISNEKNPQIMIPPPIPRPTPRPNNE